MGWPRTLYLFKVTNGRMYQTINHYNTVIKSEYIT